jgi:hypothetical protein
MLTKSTSPFYGVFFTKTLKKMKLDITHMLTKTTSPFYGIVPGNVAIFH